MQASGNGDLLYIEHLQWVAGQYPVAQFLRHQSSICLLLYGGIDLQPSGLGALVGMGLVGLGGSGGASVGGGGRVGAGGGGTLPSLFVILISAQFTKVSCGPLPIPQSLFPSHPQLFPTRHHHCNTQWSHVKPLGSLSLIVNTSFPCEVIFHLVSPLGCLNT